MATSKSIGSLYVDIIARTEQLEGDMAKVKRAMSDTGAATEQAGKKAKEAFESFKLWNSFQGRGMTGIAADMMALMMALQAVKQELMYVYDNIEKIPGIPAEAVQNVLEYKIALKDARNAIDGIIATGMSWGIQAAKMVGVGFAEMLHGDQGELDTTLDSLEKIKLASDPAYYDKVRAAVTRLAEARKDEAKGTLLAADKISYLQDQAEAYRVHSIASSTDLLTRLTDQIAMEVRLTEAVKIRTDLVHRVTMMGRQDNYERVREALNEMSQLQKIAKLKAEIIKEGMGTGIVANQGGQFSVASLDRMTPAQLQTITEKYPEVLKLMGLLRQEYAKIRSSSEEMRDSFVGGFKDMATVGRQFVTGLDTDFNKVLQSITDKIIETFISLALINPILNAMFGSSKGFNILPTLFGGVGKKAAGGPGSGLTLVGEEGPELANFGGGGSVIPAWKTRQMLGAGGGGNHYMIDARGADIGVEQRIMSLLLRLAGPGVVEQRSESARVNNIFRRRQ